MSEKNCHFNKTTGTIILDVDKLTMETAKRNAKTENTVSIYFQLYNALMQKVQEDDTAFHTTFKASKLRAFRFCSSV